MALLIYWRKRTAKIFRRIPSNEIILTNPIGEFLALPKGNPIKRDFTFAWTVLALVRDPERVPNHRLFRCSRDFRILQSFIDFLRGNVRTCFLHSTLLLSILTIWRLFHGYF